MNDFITLNKGSRAPSTTYSTPALSTSETSSTYCSAGLVLTALFERGEKAIMAGAPGVLQIPFLHPGQCAPQVVHLGSLPWLVMLYFNSNCALKEENQPGAFQEWRGNYKIQEVIENG